MTARAERLEALDVFRGLSVAAMILVSAPGTWSAVYWPLDHALWNGWTPTDLVFPFFLFAMGAAVPFAAARRRGNARLFWRHVARRAALLFALGLILNTVETPPPLRLAAFRIAGVLQRIAIVYLAVVWITETWTERGQIAAAAMAFIGYWIAMTWIPVPGVGAGVLSPEGNLASFIDRALMGRHLLTRDYDPEGVLSTIPSIGTALCGVFAGRWLMQAGRQGRPHASATLWAAGAAGVLAGLLWGRVFPLNKNLWTSSFGLFSAGLGAQFLALCHWLIDVKHWRRPASPFRAFGRNALAAYFLSIGLDSLLSRWTVPDAPSLKALLFRAGFASWIRPCCGAEAASLAYAAAYVCLWAVVVSVMDRRGIFISI